MHWCQSEVLLAKILDPIHLYRSLGAETLASLGGFSTRLEPQTFHSCVLGRMLINRQGVPYPFDKAFIVTPKSLW